jgi:cell division protein ZapA
MAATVTVTIVGRSYEVTCDPGQEDYVRRLSEEVDRRAAALLRNVGNVGEARLLIMAALTLADELAETKEAIERERAAAEPTDAALAGGIEKLARRLDAIAERLESA